MEALRAPDRRTDDPHRGFRDRVPAAVSELDQAVREVLGTSWDEPFRRRALGAAAALAEASRAEGLRQLASLARGVASLLELPPEDRAGMCAAVQERLMELLGLLQEEAALLARRHTA